MVEEVLCEDPVLLLRLECVKQKETSFNLDALTAFYCQFVATIVNLSNQLLHIEAVERCDANEKLEQDDTERPRIHRVIVCVSLEHLRGLVKWSPHNRLLGLCAIKDRRKTEVREFD